MNLNVNLRLHYACLRAIEQIGWSSWEYDDIDDDRFLTAETGRLPFGQSSSCDRCCRPNFSVISIGRGVASSLRADGDNRRCAYLDKRIFERISDPPSGCIVRRVVSVEFVWCAKPLRQAVQQADGFLRRIQACPILVLTFGGPERQGLWFSVLLAPPADDFHRCDILAEEMGAPFLYFRIGQPLPAKLFAFCLRGLNGLRFTDRQKVVNRHVDRRRDG